MATIRRSFARWGAVANVYLVEVTDTGLSYGDPDGVPPQAGHIRQGAYELSSYAGGTAYLPPSVGNSVVDGDITLNLNFDFQVAPGGEGDLQAYNSYSNFDFEGIVMHEIGHALGLLHSSVRSVMSVNPAHFQFINRELDADDIAGLQALYGPHLAADFDHDNDVDATDFGVWQTNFGTVSGEGDAGGDGLVEARDFLTWQREFGPETAPQIAHAVREPSLAFSAVAPSVSIAVYGRRARGKRLPHGE